MHPISDPRGHLACVTSPEPASEDEFNWGRRLFNNGFYWEAHEAWEGLWISAGRSGTEADMLKGLIRLAACGVKCLQGNRNGAQRHALRAFELFHKVELSSGDGPLHTKGLLGSGVTSSRSAPLRSRAHVPGQTVSGGLDLKCLIRLAEQLALDPPLLPEERRSQAAHGGVPVLGEVE